MVRSSHSLLATNWNRDTQGPSQGSEQLLQELEALNQALHQSQKKAHLLQTVNGEPPIHLQQPRSQPPVSKHVSFSSRKDAAHAGNHPSDEVKTANSAEMVNSTAQSDNSMQDPPPSHTRLHARHSLSHLHASTILSLKHDNVIGSTADMASSSSLLSAHGGSEWIDKKPEQHSDAASRIDYSLSAHSSPSRNKEKYTSQELQDVTVNDSSESALKFDFSSSDKKSSLWNWKPFRALSHIGRSRWHCVFSAYVHAIEGLSPAMNGLRLSVHIRKEETKDGAVQTMPGRVLNGAAEFQETLFMKCTLYSNKGPSSTMKFMEKAFVVSVIAYDINGLNFGRYHIDFSRLLSDSVDAGRGHPGKGDSWHSVLDLTGKARGGKLAITFNYEVLDKDSSPFGNTSSRFRETPYHRSSLQFNFSFPSPGRGKPRKTAVKVIQRDSLGASESNNNYNDLLATDKLNLDETRMESMDHASQDLKNTLAANERGHSAFYPELSCSSVNSSSSLKVDQIPSLEGVLDKSVAREEEDYYATEDFIVTDQGTEIDAAVGRCRDKAITKLVVTHDGEQVSEHDNSHRFVNDKVDEQSQTADINSVRNSATDVDESVEKHPNELTTRERIRNSGGENSDDFVQGGFQDALNNLPHWVNEVDSSVEKHTSNAITELGLRRSLAQAARRRFYGLRNEHLSKEEPGGEQQEGADSNDQAKNVNDNEVHTDVEKIITVDEGKRRDNIPQVKVLETHDTLMHGRGATLLSKENAEVEPYGDGSVSDKVCSDEREAISVTFISRLQENTTAHVPESNNDAQITVAHDMDNVCENVDIKDTQTYSKDITEVTADHAPVEVGHDPQEKNEVSDAGEGGERGMHVYEAAGEICSTSKPESLHNVQRSAGIHSAFDGDEIYNNICSRGDKCDGVATKEREICSENTKAETADHTAAGEVNDLKEEERASQNGLSVYSRAGESCSASEDENVYNDKQYEGPQCTLVNEKCDILKCPEDNGCDDASIQDREVDSEDMNQVTNNHTAVGELNLKEEERASEFVEDNERDVSDYGAAGESCSPSEDGKAYKDHDDDRHADVSTEGRQIYSEETREVTADRTAVQKVDDLKEDEMARNLNEVSERNMHVYDSAGESFAASLDERVYDENQYGQSYNALEDDDIYNHKCSEGDECEGVGAKEREICRTDTREIIADHSAAEEVNDLKQEETISNSYENSERDVHVFSAARESCSASEDEKVLNNIQYGGTDGNLEADKVYDLKCSEADGRKDIGTEVNEVYNKDTTELRADHSAGEVDDLKEEETAKDPNEGSERGMHVYDSAGESSSASEDERIYNDKQNMGTQVPLEGGEVYDCKCFHIDGCEDVGSKGRDIYSRDTREVSVDHTTAEVDDLKKGEWVNDSYKYCERSMNVLSETGRKSCSGSEDENVHIDKQYEETHSADQAYDLKCHENHECEDVEAEDTAIYSNDTREVAANHTVVREVDDLKEKQRTSDPNADSERGTLVYDSAGELYSASENESQYADKQYEQTHLVAEGDEVYDSKCAEDDDRKRAGTKEGGIDTRDTTEVLADHTTAREMDLLKEDERPRDLINEDSERGMHICPAAAESFITFEDKTQNDKQGCCGTHGVSEDDEGQICSEDDECEGVGTAERKILRKDTAVAKVDNRNEERVSDTKKDNEIGMHVHGEEDYCTGSEDGRPSNYKHFEGSDSGLKEDEDSSHLCFEHNGSEEVCINQRQSYSNGSSELITDHSAKEDDDFEEGERKIDYIGSEDRGVHNHIGSEDRGMHNNEQSEDAVSIFEGEEAHNHLCSEAEDIHGNKPLGVNNTLSEEQDGNTRTSKAMSSSNVNSVEEIGTFIDVVREIALDGFKNVQSGDEYGESRLDVLAGNEIEKMNSGVIASVSQNDEAPNLAHSKDEVVYMDRKSEGTNTVFEDEKIHYDKFSEKQHARVHTSKIVNCSVVGDKEIKACADIAREAGIWSFEDVQKCEKVVEKDLNEDLEKGSMMMRSIVEARPYVVLNEHTNAMIDPMSNGEDSLLDCILDEGIDENLYDNTGTEVDLVVGEFLDMLGKGNNPASSDHDSDLDSPRAQLLKKFEEKNVLKVAFGLDFDDIEFLQDATSTDEDEETHLQSALQAETEKVVVKQPDFISNHSNASTKTEHEVVLLHHTSFESRETKDELDQTFSSERFKGEFASIDHSAPHKWMPKQLQSGWNQVSSIEQFSEQSVYLDDIMGAKSENQGEHFLTEGIDMELSVQHGANLHLNGTEISHLNVDYGMVGEKESALLGDTTKLMFKDEQEQNYPGGNTHVSSKERNKDSYRSVSEPADPDSYIDEDWDFEHDEELVSFLEVVEPETRRPTAQSKQIGSRAKMLEDAEIEALMVEWGLDEEDIMSSPPIPMRRV